MYNNPLRRRPMTGQPPSWGQSPGQGFDPRMSHWPGEEPGGSVGPIPGAPPQPAPGTPGMPGTPWSTGQAPGTPDFGAPSFGTGIAPGAVASTPGFGGTGIADFASLGSAPTPVSSIGVPGGVAPGIGDGSAYGNGVAPGVPPYGGGVATPMQRRGWQGAGGPFGMRPGGQNWGNWGMPNFAGRLRGLI
jgi:hypothetical protein